MQKLILKNSNKYTMRDERVDVNDQGDLEDSPQCFQNLSKQDTIQKNEENGITTTTLEN